MRQDELSLFISVLSLHTTQQDDLWSVEAKITYFASQDPPNAKEHCVTPKTATLRAAFLLPPILDRLAVCVRSKGDFGLGPHSQVGEVDLQARMSSSGAIGHAKLKISGEDKNCYLCDVQPMSVCVAELDMDFARRLLLFVE